MCASRRTFSCDEVPVFVEFWPVGQRYSIISRWVQSDGEGCINYGRRRKKNRRRSVMKRMRMAIAVTGILLANALSAQSAVKPFHLDETTIGDVQAAYQSHALTAMQLVQA